MLERKRPVRRAALGVAAVAAGMTAASAAVWAQLAPPSLKTTAPIVGDLSAYVRNTPEAKEKLIVLGKALFWDQGIGSTDVACATCHFHAGADSRVKNQLNPNLNNTFDPTGSGGGGPNYTLKKSDFPTTKMNSETNREAGVQSHSNDVISSQGTFLGTYVSTPLNPNNPNDRCDSPFDPVFHVGADNTRRVEPRNTPTMINAVFNKKNFWDGRANNIFNGVTPLGGNDTVFLSKHSGGWQKVPVAVLNLALASQAVGPIVSDFEMICQGRSLAEFGKKVLPRQPLAGQRVAEDDGVLGKYTTRRTRRMGIEGTYTDLIKAVFKDEWWNGGTVPTNMPNSGYDQMEANFSLFWGIAVASYQATLISDNSHYDRVQEGLEQFSGQEIHGLQLFNQFGCIGCHNGPLFTEASQFTWTDSQAEQDFDAAFAFRKRGVDMKVIVTPSFNFIPALADEGFFNIGVSPTEEDRGLGAGTFSVARKYLASITANPPGPPQQVIEGLNIDPCLFTFPLSNDVANGCPIPNPAGFGVVVDGAFKIPGLRNVELTGPYFHNGMEKDLMGVLKFYRRGGNRQASGPNSDSTGFDTQGSNLGPIFPFQATDDDLKDLEAFLKSLTDKRVACEMAPFDHPALRVQHGIEGDHLATYDANGDGKIGDEYIDVPAVGKGGLPAMRRPCLGTFDSKLAAN